MNWLNGKKAFLCAGMMIIFTVVYAFGGMTPYSYQVSMGILWPLAIAALRDALRKCDFK